MSGSHEFIAVGLHGTVAEVELRHPPNNHVSVPMVAELSTALERLDGERNCRAIVLCAAGKHFCAGADLANRGPDGADPSEVGGRHLYKEAIRLWRTRKPIVAAVQGAAVGAGLGLAVMADFRVSCPEARFSANFTRLGFHPGFGLTATLPRLIGVQHAALMLYTGRRFTGEDAKAMGLVDQLVPQAGLREAAHALALEIAQSAPLAIVSTRETLRRGLAEAVQAATEREYQEQAWLRRTGDYTEGVRAMSDRRLPDFKGE
ncbi:MAG TPA: enoyl-CoA hydratase/isomerase family protein [Acetobacteraceae bacterium]|nr:enoyl-CoA hydratase/isomerase family protein [Acetobacteraceae bacterium]